MTKLTPAERTRLEETGVTQVGGVTGGAKKQRYWTPDGREIWAEPAMRTWVKRNAKRETIDSGTRDANLDSGWLLQPPTNPKPYCSGCDKWHDTQEEINGCLAKKQAFTERWEKKARAMKKKEGGEVEEIKEDVEELKSDMSDIKSMLKRLLEK